MSPGVYPPWCEILTSCNTSVSDTNMHQPWYAILTSCNMHPLQLVPVAREVAPPPEQQEPTASWPRREVWVQQKIYIPPQ